MRAIFISCRRNDSQGRLFDDLIQQFGEQTVFMDVAGIEAGRDFRKAIEESVAQCGVLLVVMGPEWLTAKDESWCAAPPCPARSNSQTNSRTWPIAAELTYARWKSDMRENNRASLSPGNEHFHASDST